MRQRALFTLIELLVVVSIIAVLASILLPALASARARVRMTACQSNLKQLGLGNQLYMHDYNDWFFPTSMSMVNSSGSTSDGAKGTYYGMRWHRTLIEERYFESELTFAGTADASKLTRCKGAVRCPTAQERELYVTGNSPIGYNAQVGMDVQFWSQPAYNWNGAWAIRNHGGTATVGNITRTDTTPISYDDLYGNRPPKKGWHWGANYASEKRHPGIPKLKTLLVDGHVRAYTYEQWFSNELTEF